MLQAGRSRVSFRMRSFDFSIHLILPAAQWPLGSTQPLTEMSTRNLPGGKGRLALKADNLTAICETPRPVTAIALHIYYKQVDIYTQRTLLPNTVSLIPTRLAVGVIKS
jgi:hypothetical protein